jgi:hypothetical protein
LNPGAPFVRETLTQKNTVKTVPADAIECFVKVKLKNNSGGVPMVAAVEQICSIRKIIRNAAPKNESRLVIANEGRDDRL